MSSLLGVALSLVTAASSILTPTAPLPNPEIAPENYLGAVDLAEADGYTAAFGGISGIDHVEGDRYVVISDDKGDFGPTRAYNISIDGNNITIDNTILLNPSGEGMDPEAIRVLPDGTLLWTNEGPIPFLVKSTVDGSELQRIKVPAHHIPNEDETYGIRHNNGPEGLTLVDTNTALTINEGPLAQDSGPRTETDPALVRITLYDLSGAKPIAEYPLEVGPVYPGASDRGVSEVLAVGDGSYLIIERGWVKEEKRNRAQIYRIWLDGEDILDKPILDGTEKAVTKELVFDFDELTASTGVHPDNVEGLAWGKTLDSGERELLVISDNNFNPTQRTLLHRIRF